MFRIEQNPIETSSGDDFRAQVAAQAAPQPDLRTALAERQFKIVRGHLDIHDRFRARALRGTPAMTRATRALSLKLRNA
jgi:hypothetical protein